MTASLSAIILAYGSDELLRESLDALRIALDAVDGETELIVVRNRVSAGSSFDLDNASDVVLVEPGRNLGFAGGANSALEHARGEWVLLVNDDCTVEPTAVVELLAAAETGADIGAVAAQVRFATRPGTINSAGIQVDVLGIATERLLGASISASETELTEVFGASGSAGLYRRRMLDDIGAFDESFFAYLEDADVAWRARMGGWRCLYAPAAIVRHHHSSSLGHGSPAKHYLVGRNRVRMLAKNATSQQLIRSSPWILVYELAYVAFAVSTSFSFAPINGRVRGIVDWPTYRRAGARHRAAISLSPAQGLRRALNRHFEYEVER